MACPMVSKHAAIVRNGHSCMCGFGASTVSDVEVDFGHDVPEFAAPPEAAAEAVSTEPAPDDEEDALEPSNPSEFSPSPGAVTPPAPPDDVELDEFYEILPDDAALKKVES